MSAVITTALIVSAVANVVAYFVSKRFIKRTMQFDNMFNNVSDDLEKFIDYFDTLLAKHTFSNSPDVMSMSKNMRIMRDRFEMYVNAFDDKSVVKQLAEEKPPGEPPVYVD